MANREEWQPDIEKSDKQQIYITLRLPCLHYPTLKKDFRHQEPSSGENYRNLRTSILNTQKLVQSAKNLWKSAVQILLN